MDDDSKFLVFIFVLALPGITATACLARGLWCVYFDIMQPRLFRQVQGRLLDKESEYWGRIKAVFLDESGKERTATLAVDPATWKTYLPLEFAPLFYPRHRPENVRLREPARMRAFGWLAPVIPLYFVSYLFFSSLSIPLVKN